MGSKSRDERLPPARLSAKLSEVPRWVVILVVASCCAACTQSETPGASSNGGASSDPGLVLDVPGFEPDCVGGAAGATPGTTANAGESPTLGGDACVPSVSRDYLNDVAPILSSCHGEVCHGGAFLQASQLQTLIGAPAAECCGTRELIAPGHPDQSYVLDKVRGNRLCSGARMPLGGPYLSAEQVQILSDWICEGARLPR